MANENKKRKIFDNKYEILEIIGRGDSSVVYHAKKIENGQDIAIKVLVKKSGEDLKNVLRKESLALVSCRHDNVIKLEDFQIVGNICYLAMEYASNNSLLKFLDDKVIDANYAKEVLIQSLKALDFIHKIGFIHRDISPENLLIMSDKSLRLGDFGQGVVTQEVTSQFEMKKGIQKSPFVAPEYSNNLPITPLSDIYSLGVTFFFLLTHSTSLNSSLIEDKKLATCLAKMTNANPSGRFQDANSAVLFLEQSGAQSINIPKKTSNQLTKGIDETQNEEIILDEIFDEESKESTNENTGENEDEEISVSTDWIEDIDDGDDLFNDGDEKVEDKQKKEQDGDNKSDKDDWDDELDDDWDEGWDDEFKDNDNENEDGDVEKEDKDLDKRLEEFLSASNKDEKYQEEEQDLNYDNGNDNNEFGEDSANDFSNSDYSTQNQEYGNDKNDALNENQQEENLYGENDSSLKNSIYDSMTSSYDNIEEKYANRAENVAENANVANNFRGSDAVKSFNEMNKKKLNDLKNSKSGSKKEFKNKNNFSHAKSPRKILKLILCLILVMAFCLYAYVTMKGEEKEVGQKVPDTSNVETEQVIDESLKLEFPNLPNGSYEGEIEGLMTKFFNFDLSVKDKNILIDFKGLGLKPFVSRIEDDARELEFRSNGLVLVLKATKATDKTVEGVAVSKITGEQAVWRIKKIR